MEEMQRRKIAQENLLSVIAPKGASCGMTHQKIKRKNTQLRHQSGCSWTFRSDRMLVWPSPFRFEILETPPPDESPEPEDPHYPG